jgi:fructose-1,6-bisphosphatase II / sedoheptulose-1,7-bisphosphatase
MPALGHAGGLCDGQINRDIHHQCCRLSGSPTARVHAPAAARGGVLRERRSVSVNAPGHENLIAEVHATNAAIGLITDGSVAGVIQSAEAVVTGIDI